MVGAPARRIGAVVLIRNPEGDVLLVRRLHTLGWQFPGGEVRPDEPIAVAGARELCEDTGLTRVLTRLLALDHVPANPETGATEGFDLVCDGGTLTAEQASRVTVPDSAAHELVGLRWVSLDQLDAYALPHQERRIRHAVAAHDHGLGLPLLGLGEPV
ncbi:NUDIX domain-containing protein [uncultured Streptomyces sp.]|uniref:NUDIX domain-containing protein n=1 Tax=uncultured Streptomyces sp. TaxID=174707 RepID=UPI002603C2B8|nr:NUDIX domain-containing protein [uncultured Streptomyces sp.]